MKTFLSLFLLLSTAFASQTTLTGNIKNAQGNPLNGYLVMRLPVQAQDTTTNVAVLSIPVYFRVINGVVTGGAPLYDVVNMQPAGLYYVARGYDQANNLVFYGNYVVTGATFDIGTAVPTAVTTSNVSYSQPIFANQTNNFTVNQFFTTITSSCSPAAATGFLRLCNSDQIGWRNNGNTGDLFSGATFVGGLDWLSVNGLLFGNNTVSATVGSDVTVKPLTQAAGAGKNANINASDASGANLNGGNVHLGPGLKTGVGTNGTVEIMHGLCGAASTGCQQADLASCTTAAVVLAECASTVVFPNAFDDTSYRVLCGISSVLGGGSPFITNYAIISTTQVAVGIAAVTAIASHGNFHCVAFHL